MALASILEEFDLESTNSLFQIAFKPFLCPAASRPYERRYFRNRWATRESVLSVRKSPGRT